MYILFRARFLFQECIVNYSLLTVWNTYFRINVWKSKFTSNTQQMYHLLVRIPSPLTCFLLSHHNHTCGSSFLLPFDIVLQVGLPSLYLSSQMHLLLTLPFDWFAATRLARNPSGKVRIVTIIGIIITLIVTIIGIVIFPFINASIPDDISVASL